MDLKQIFQRQKETVVKMLIFGGGVKNSFGIKRMFSGLLGQILHHYGHKFMGQSCVTLDDENVVIKIGNAEYCYDIVNPVLSNKGPVGVVFLYDITSSMSWEVVKPLIEEAVEKRRQYPIESVKGRFMILGCNCHLVESRQVSFGTVKDFADENGLLLMEISAKENINVEYAFLSFAAQLIETSHNYVQIMQHL